MNDDDVLDRAIDDVARELTEGAPSQGFTGRVRARVGIRPCRRAWPWQLTGAAAALSLVVYMLWPVQDREPLRVRPVPTRTSAERSPEPEATPQAAPARSNPPVLARATTRSAPARRPQSKPRMRIAVDPDAPQLGAIPIPADLTLKPLEIAELTIAPLDLDKESR